MSTLYIPIVLQKQKFECLISKLDNIHKDFLCQIIDEQFDCHDDFLTAMSLIYHRELSSNLYRHLNEHDSLILDIIISNIITDLADQFSLDIGCLSDKHDINEQHLFRLDIIDHLLQFYLQAEEQSHQTHNILNDISLGGYRLDGSFVEDPPSTYIFINPKKLLHFNRQLQTILTEKHNALAHWQQIIIRHLSQCAQNGIDKQAGLLLLYN